MSIDTALDDGQGPRRLRRLELRYRSAQNVLAEARALHASLREIPAAGILQLHQAQQRVEWATQHLIDIQRSIDLLEDSEDAYG